MLGDAGFERRLGAPRRLEIRPFLWVFLFAEVPGKDTRLGLSFGGALALAKGAGLHAVAADLHRAPLARAVPGAVVEGPLASIVGTDLQPAPYPLVRGPHHGGQDMTKAADTPDDAGPSVAT